MAIKKNQSELSNKEIQAKLNVVEVKLTNGEKFNIKTSAKLPNGILTLSTDPFNHPAWNKKQSDTNSNAKNSQVEEFKNKLGNISFL